MSSRIRILHAATLVALPSLLLVFLLPRIAHAPWSAIGRTWRVLTPTDLVLLSGVWFLGLATHSSVLMATMPGLTRRRALTLNLTGSAVANLVPLGGGLGIGLNFAMARRWGHSTREFSVYTALSNACSVVAKALLAVLAVSGLVAADVEVGHQVMLSAAVGSGLMLCAVVVAGLGVGSAMGPRVVGQVVDRLPGRVRRGACADGATVVAQLMQLREGGVCLVRAGWRQMTLGMVGYYALQALLLLLCLTLLGSALTPAAVLAVFAVERALTALPLTPGGSGVAEVGATALALALGGSPLGSAGGVLLYRGFTFGAEILVGSVWLVGWLLLRRGRAGTDSAAARTVGRVG